MPSRDKPGETRHPSAATRSDARAERRIANWWRNSGLLRDALVSVWRERENPRLGGCAGRLQRTSLNHLNSLITGKIQRISVETASPRVRVPLKSKGLRRRIPYNRNSENLGTNSEMKLSNWESSPLKSDRKPVGWNFRKGQQLSAGGWRLVENLQGASRET